LPQARAGDIKRLLRQEVEQLVVQVKRVGVGLAEVMQAVEAQWERLDKSVEVLRKLIQASNLWKRFGRHDALQGLSLTAPDGSAYALIGANGAGKTTTIKILMNILEPTRGSAAILGVDSHRISPLAALGKDVSRVAGEMRFNRNSQRDNLRSRELRRKTAVKFIRRAAVILRRGAHEIEAGALHFVPGLIVSAQELRQLLMRHAPSFRARSRRVLEDRAVVGGAVCAAVHLTGDGSQPALQPVGQESHAQQSHLDFLSRSRELGTGMGHADVNEMPDLRQPCGLDCGADRRQVDGEAAPM